MNQFKVVNINVQINMKRKDALLLFLAIGFIIGYTYSVDTPQALEIPLRSPPYNFTSSQFNLIYFSTFLLIGVLQIPIGIFIDRYPIKRTLLAMLITLLISQTVIAMMFQFRPQNYFVIILLMRSIFGLCGQGLYTVQCLIMSIFAQQEYQFLAGIALAFPFVFDALNSVVTTHVYDATQNLPLAWYIGCFVCVISLICGIWMNKSIIGHQNQQRNKKVQGEHNFFKELKTMPKQFWVMAFFIFFAQASLGPFNDNLNQLLVERFGISYTDAGKLLLIPFSMLAVFTVLVGYCLKKNPGLRRISMLVSTGNYLLAHFVIFFLPNTKNPTFIYYIVIIYFLLSMSFNFAVYYSSISPSISFLVDEGVLGTAWGVAGSAIGFSQCLVPLLFILIIGDRGDLGVAYKDLSGVGIMLATVSLGFAMWVNYYDYEILDIKYSQSQQFSSKSSASEKQQYAIQPQSKSLQQSLLTNEKITQKKQKKDFVGDDQQQ